LAIALLEEGYLMVQSYNILLRWSKTLVVLDEDVA